MSDFLEGLGIFFGVLAGIVAGTGIMLVTQWVNKKRNENQTLKNLKFEFELNIKKIDKWLELIMEYRNAVNANAIGTFAGYFDLSRVVSVTANAMFYSGLLYKYLDHDDIGKLQVIFGEFSIYLENYLNNQVAQNKANFNQAKAAEDVNFWERKFKEHRQTLGTIMRKIR